MKITFVGTFDVEDMKEINNVIEQQHTSDRELETVVCDYGDFEAKIIVEKWISSEPYNYDNTYIDKIIFRKVKK